jgi:hypothetical protein
MLRGARDACTRRLAEAHRFDHYWRLLSAIPGRTAPPPELLESGYRGIGELAWQWFDSSGLNLRTEKLHPRPSITLTDSCFCCAYEGEHGAS